MAKMTEKHKVLAYVLNKEMGYTQSAIGKLMGISQATVSNMCKEMIFKVRIQNLDQELQEARILIQQKGLSFSEPVYFVDERIKQEDIEN